MTLLIHIENVSHEEAEDSLFSTCGFAPLKAASFVFSGRGPNVWRLWQRNADLVVADGGRVVCKSAQIRICAEDGVGEPAVKKL